MTKYKLTIKDLLIQGGAARLERDKHKREDIMKTLYRETPGVSQQEREKIVSSLYDRREKC